MTRKLTLFLVCAFEIALILFVAAWSVRADQPRGFEDVFIGQECQEHISKKRFDGGYFSTRCRKYVNEVFQITVVFETLDPADLIEMLHRKYDTSKWRIKDSHSDPISFFVYEGEKNILTLKVYSGSRYGLDGFKSVLFFISLPIDKRALIAKKEKEFNEKKLAEQRDKTIIKLLK